MKQRFCGCSDSRYVMKYVLFFIVSCVRLFAQEPLFTEDWRWSHFTTKSGLPSNNVLQIFETEDSTIWVNTTEGIAWFDGYEFNKVLLPNRKDSYQSFIRSVRGENLVVFSMKSVFWGNKNGFREIRELQQTQFMEAVQNNTLLFLKNDSIFSYTQGEISVPLIIPGYFQGTVSEFGKVKNGSLWLKSTMGIYKLRDTVWQLLLPSPEGIFIINGIEENSAGYGALAIVNPLSHQGLWEWNKSVRPTLYMSTDATFTNSFDIDLNGNIITVEKNNEIRIKQIGKWKSYSRLNPLMKNPRSVFISNHNDVWFGGENGMFVYKVQQSRWNLLGHPSMMKRNMVNEIVIMPDEQIWLATADGIEILGPGNRRKWIRNVLGKSIAGVTGMDVDEKGNVWISSGSAFSGLYQWNGKKWKHHPVTGSQTEIYFHKITKDRQQQLWFLPLSARENSYYKKLTPYRLVNDTIKPWTEIAGKEKLRLYSFVEDAHGGKWFGTITGLQRWKEGTIGLWEVLYSNLKKPRIFTLAYGPNDNIWFGDQDGGGGLGYVNQKDSIGYFTSRDGLVNDNIWDLVVDSSGVLWIATERGLGSYNQGEWRIYDERSGLKYPFIWPIVPRSEKVYVGTLGGGLAILDRTIPIPPSPRIKLEEPIIEEAKTTIQWKALAFNGELPPDEVQTRYRLNDEEWSAWNTQRSITYQKLEPGNYHFYLQARGVFGQYDTPGKQVFFTIQPPLLKRPVFFLPIGTLSLLSIIFAVSYFVRRRKSEAALRRSEERFRTITETSHSAIFIFADSRLLFVNSEACRLTKFTEDELLRKSFMQLLATDEQQSNDSGIARMKYRGDSIKRFEGKIHCADGSDRWADFILGSITFEGKEATIATAFDITERKQSVVQLMKYQHELRTLTAQLSISEEQERRKMATYLHDSIGATLAFCKIKLGELQAGISSDTNLSVFKEIREMLTRAIQDTRSLTVELSPPILYELGLVQALEWLVEKMMTEHRIQFEFHDDKEPKPLEDEVKVMLFHAVRELLVNIIKHARATRVTVTTQCKGHHLEISVHDNGVGFDSTQVLDAARSKSWRTSKMGFGIFNIRERISHIGGETIIQSRTTAENKRGTTIRLLIPLSLHSIGEYS
ncbi:MAG: PAS domain S-box protein [Ignavibacteriae bacterium]|nr:PAS domain S-box protein [Ignavibacteriota bacterium]